MSCMPAIVLGVKLNYVRVEVMVTCHSNSIKYSSPACTYVVPVNCFTVLLASIHSQKIEHPIFVAVNS